MSKKRFLSQLESSGELHRLTSAFCDDDIHHMTSQISDDHREMTSSFGVGDLAKVALQFSNNHDDFAKSDDDDEDYGNVMSSIHSDCDETDSMSECGSDVPNNETSQFPQDEPITAKIPFSVDELIKVITPLSDKELLKLSVKEVNQKLKGQPRHVIMKAKRRRRTLKNRGYATNCRVKRVTQKHDMETDSCNLRHQIERLNDENAMYRYELSTLRMKYEHILRFSPLTPPPCSGFSFDIGPPTPTLPDYHKQSLPMQFSPHVIKQHELSQTVPNFHFFPSFFPSPITPSS